MGEGAVLGMEWDKKMGGNGKRYEVKMCVFVGG